MGHQLVRGRGGFLADPLVRTAQLFMGTRTRPTTPPASHPPLLVWHPFTTPPVQPLISTDAHRDCSPRTSAEPGRFISRSRVQPCPTHMLALTLQLHNPPRGSTPLVQSPRRSLVVGQISPLPLTDNSSTNFCIVCFLDDPGPIKIDLLPSFYATSRSVSTGPGTFSVIRPRDWLAVSYAMLTGPAELPLSPLRMSVH